MRAGIAVLWSAGGWPTAEGVAKALSRAEASYSGRLTGTRWPPGDVSGLPGPLSAALDRLLAAGEVDAVGGGRLRPRRPLVEAWLPLVQDRELRDLEEPGLPHTSARACLAAAGNEGGPPVRRVLPGDDVVAAELRARAEHWRALTDRPQTDRSRSVLPAQLEEQASLWAQLQERQSARECWGRLAHERLDRLDGQGGYRGDSGALLLGALEDAVLSEDAGLLARALDTARALDPAASAEGLSTKGTAWSLALRGLLTADAAAVASGAERLDAHDRRKRRDSADVGLGSAALALLDRDGEALQDALVGTLDQHVRYLRHGAWRGDASPVRPAMVLRRLAGSEGLHLPPALGHRVVTVHLRCLDEWQGEPVHRHRARGSADLAP